MNKLEYQRQTINVIGVLATEAYQAKISKIGARKARAICRSNNPCTNEVIYGDGDVKPQPCWLVERLPKIEWCDGCKAVQPNYEQYIKAVKDCRVAHFKLSNAIKKYLKEASNAR